MTQESRKKGWCNLPIIF